MDESGGLWNKDLIEEAHIILSMPLSRSGCTNKLIWHYTKNGLYTVKSGYLIAQDLSQNGEIGRKGVGESSDGQEKNEV